MNENEFRAALLLLGYDIKFVQQVERDGSRLRKYEVTPSICAANTYIFTPASVGYTGFDGVLKNVVTAIGEKDERTNT